MLFEIVAVALVGCLAYWLWARFRQRWNPQPGERWKVIDARDCSSGSVNLMQSENDRTWIVQMFPDDENMQSKIARYATEDQAREAFSKDQ